MTKFLVIAAAVIAVATPSLAAEYYIVRGPDKKCKVVETRPTDTTIVQVGPLAFTAREEADREIRVVCKEQFSDVDEPRVIEREVRRDRY